MSALTRLVITSNGSDADFKSQCDLSVGGLVSASNFAAYIDGVTGGNLGGALLQFQVGAVKAAGTLTVATGGSGNNETCTICNVTFTAKTTGATGNQFNISATAATQATNMAAAINASANLTGKVTAIAELGVVTITAVAPGLLGNGLELSAGTLANVTLSAMASGADGTAYSIDLR